jgi:hypothetical protein
MLALAIFLCALASLVCGIVAGCTATDPVARRWGGLYAGISLAWILLAWVLIVVFRRQLMMLYGQM